MLGKCRAWKPSKMAVFCFTKKDIWDRIKQDAHLNYRTSIELFEKNIEEFKTIDIETQKKILCEILGESNRFDNWGKMVT